jgi:murein DD-endopeptidase MepM/ murein hydrolase activator NlpD
VLLYDHVAKSWFSCSFLCRGRLISGQYTSFRFLCTHGRLPLRERYWRKRNGGLRLRYALAGYASSSAAFTFLALSFFPALSIPLSQHQTQWAALAPTQATPQVLLKPDMPVIPTLAVAPSLPVVTPVQKPAVPPLENKTILATYRDEDGQIRRSSETRITNALLVAGKDQGPEKPASKNLTIAAGDTLTTLLVRAGVSSDDSERAIRAMRDHIRPSDLRPGQVLQLDLADADAPYQFNRLALAVDPIKTVEVTRGWGGLMTAAVHEKPLKSEITANVAVIKSSLYGAAAAAGIPNAVTAEAIKVFGHQIDFQRDIHPGDKLEIMYDRKVTDDGYVAGNGGMVFARLYANGRQMTVYRFDQKDGTSEYFDEKGHSARKALLRTPMDGGRVTSGFGMRKHPILGYSKMHKGVDFGAPTGTPIFAAGDGTVEMAGRNGAYGHYVRLKHNTRLSTAYAHLSRYASGLRPGKKVKQGQVIGYVGTTGRSTGPHLHYEILLNGGQVNPQSVKMPTMTILTGQDLKNFKTMVDRLNREFREKTNGIHYASSDKTAVN